MHIDIDTKTGIARPKLTKPEQKAMKHNRTILAALAPYNIGNPVVENIDKVIARIQDDGVFADEPVETPT